jgi:CcmD family protein
MEASLGYLFAAFFVAWLALLLYLLNLSARLNAAERELEALKEAGADEPSEGGGPEAP